MAPTAKLAKARSTVAAGRLDARVDQKIAAASPALQPLLNHIRGAVHEGAPGVAETIKWGMPFFELDGRNLAFLGVFKNHAALGFWSKSMAGHLAEHGIAAQEGAGSFGKLTSIDDLPAYKALVQHVRHAASEIAEGTWKSPIAARKVPKPELPVPDDFTAVLNASPQAKKQFPALPPGCRREYLEWIASAKKPETRARRITEAVNTIAQGKQRTWQYTK